MSKKMQKEHDFFFCQSFSLVIIGRGDLFGLKLFLVFFYANYNFQGHCVILCCILLAAFVEISCFPTKIFPSVTEYSTSNASYAHDRVEKHTFWQKSPQVDKLVGIVQTRSVPKPAVWC